MSAVPRARTSYDHYGDQLKEDYFEDTLDFIPLHGRQTPIGMVRSSPPNCASFSGGGQSRQRTRSDRPELGKRSRTQVEPTTMSMAENPYTQPMDPINKQHYYKKWRSQPPQPLAPIYREGRLGSPWRHVKACINNAGKHIAFIDGTVKSEENFFYPLQEQCQPPNFSLYISPRMPRRSATQVPVTYRAGGNSSYNERAKKGFKYWYHEQRPINLASRYRQKARMLTLGPSCSN